MTGPAVSVVIPTRDRAGMLAAALRTVLYQSDVDLEVIVVDDGSSEPLALPELDDERVRVVRHGSSEGVSAARNRGISQARGRWVALLDDDDLWAPDKLSSQLEAAASEGRTWVYAGDVNVDTHLRVLDGGPPPTPDEVVASLSHYNSVPAGGSNVVIRRDMLDASGTFDPSLKTSEDWDMWIRLARIGPPACVARPLVALRQHGDNASLDMRRMLSEVEIVARRYGLAADRVRHLRWAAWTALKDGHRREAAGHYLRALRAGDLSSLGRLAVAVVLPSMVERSRRLSAEHRWTEEAHSWIDALKRP